MKLIEDVGLGEIVFTNFGKTTVIEIVSTYDGRTLGTITCNEINKFILNNYTDDYEFFGIYIASIQIVDEKKIDCISGDFLLTIECNQVIIEQSELLDNVK